ncbi:MAG: hypothetical protein K6G71_00105 [Clostridiales bacterium]|nr:hypothetical protein [Clostridiales bacterium]
MFTAAGRILPRCVFWEDGRRFTIDRIVDVRRAPSLLAGGVGTRYTVRIGGKETYLFYEGSNRWFVERAAAGD